MNMVNYCVSYSDITYRDLHQFFRRRLVEVSEDEFNDL